MYYQQWSLTQWLGNCLFNVLWCLHCYSVTVSCVWTFCVKIGPVLVYYGLAFYCFLVHEESLTIDMQSSPYCSNSKQPGSGRMLLPYRKLLFFISQYCNDICCRSLVVIYNPEFQKWPFLILLFPRMPLERWRCSFMIPMVVMSLEFCGSLTCWEQLHLR